MRILARRRPILTTFDLLSQMLRSGTRFHLMLLDSDVFLYHASCPLSVHANFYSGYYREPPLEPLQNKLEFCQRWVTVAADIMRSPHARTYPFKGGLLWRLALEFGPDDLVQKALSGPSEAVDSHGIRLRDIEARLTCDTYSPYELDVILGRTR